PVNNTTVTGMIVTGFPASGVFGYGTDGMRVTRVTAINDGEYGISRVESDETVFANDVAIGNDQAGFFLRGSPFAHTLVRKQRGHRQSARDLHTARPAHHRDRQPHPGELPGHLGARRRGTGRGR